MSEAVNSVAAEEKKTIVTKKDLLKAWWKWTLAVEVPVSFDRMQALAFGYSMNKVLRKLYKDDPEELQAAMRRHTSMFNTNCDWGSIIHGITISLEEQRALGHDDISPEVIQSLKLGLMGPLAGLGDSVRAGTIAPIVTAFCISIGQTGNLIAPFLLEGILVAIVWPFAIWLLKKSYHTGKEGIQEIFSSGKLNWITTMTSTLGGITLGALAASYVTLSSPLEFVLGKGSKIALQADVLDVILKNILPLSMVLLSVYLLNKKVSAVKIILILAAVCALGVLIGIF